MVLIFFHILQPSINSIKPSYIFKHILNLIIIIPFENIFKQVILIEFLIILIQISMVIFLITERKFKYFILRWIEENSFKFRKFNIRILILIIMIIIFNAIIINPYFSCFI